MDTAGMLLGVDVGGTKIAAVVAERGGAILPTYDAVFRHNNSCPDGEKVRLVVPATEQGAGFMA
ncbi:MAG TPA: hypothetical protein EYQ83_17810, partial [Acidobacteria bacterium]|nr:hypothetical protein [Acidobacteriota bacterium]